MSYDNTLATDRDKVRFYIGDTSNDATLERLSDNEIDAMLADYSDPLVCALKCAEALLAKYAGYVTQTVGSVSVQYSNLVNQYEKLISRLKAKVATQASGAVWVGGISESEKTANETDTDRVEPAFERGFQDNER